MGNLLTKLPPVAIELVVARVLVGWISDAYILPTIAQVETYPRANTNTETITTHRAAPYECTASAAYREPIRSMDAERITPPQMADVRRPHLSARSVAGILKASIRMALTPDARNDAVCDGIPACAKIVGAYWEIVLASAMTSCLHGTTHT